MIENPYYQKMMAIKRCFVAIEKAKVWWKSEERYFRQAQMELASLNIGYGACMVIPTPFCGKIYFVQRVLFSVKEKAILPNESQLAGIRRVYSGVKKNRWVSSRRSDCVVMLCKFNEGKTTRDLLSGGLF